jgi:O-antigen/teichoic acid export membrane protein
MNYQGSRQLSSIRAFVQSAAAKLLIIGLSQAFMALSWPGVITVLQAVGLLLTVPLMLILVPRFGIEGAALSPLLSKCARFTFVLASFSRFLDRPRPGFLPRRADPLVLVDEVFRRLRALRPGVAGGEA